MGKEKKVWLGSVLGVVEEKSLAAWVEGEATEKKKNRGSMRRKRGRRELSLLAWVEGEPTKATKRVENSKEREGELLELAQVRKRERERGMHVEGIKQRLFVFNAQIQLATRDGNLP